MDTLERLKPICSTDAVRHNLATPFALTYEGRRWACATDGHALAAIPYDGELRTDGPDALKIIPNAPPKFTATLTELRAWAGGVPPPTVPCPTCAGKKPDVCEECDGTGVVDAPECYCPECPGEHDCRECNGSAGTCRTCSGDGVVYPSKRPGKIAGDVVDLNLLARALLSAPPDGEVIVSAVRELDPILFRSGDWLAVVMPLRWGKPETEFHPAAPSP